MTHFPLFMNLENKRIMIFGGGEFVLQRIDKLKPFRPLITVISEKIDERIKKLDGIEIRERGFCKSDLDENPVFVITAEDEILTEKIYTECNKRHIPVNAVDMPRFCDIIFPAVAATEHLCIGISSGGLSPTAAVRIKEEIKEMLPSEIDAVIEWMPLIRGYINKNINPDKRKKALSLIFTVAMDKNRPLTDSEVQSVLTEL